jgi:hypothetical protein
MTFTPYPVVPDWQPTFGRIAYHVNYDRPVQIRHIRTGPLIAHRYLDENPSLWRDPFGVQLSPQPDREKQFATLNEPRFDLANSVNNSTPRGQLIFNYLDEPLVWRDAVTGAVVDLSTLPS